MRPGPGSPPGGAAGRRPAVVLAAAALLFTGCWIEPAQNEELERTGSGASVESRVTEALAASAAAWNQGDLEGFMEVYLESPETTYVGGSGLKVGYDAIRLRYAPLFDPGAERDSLRFEDVRVRAVDEDVAVGIARWILHRNGRVTGTGPFTLVLRRTDGAWRIVHDHSSSAPDPPRGGDTPEADPEDAVGGP